MPELKRCPCCGGKAVLTNVTVLFESPGDIVEKIQCTICGLSIEDMYGLAADKWNKRVGEGCDSMPQPMMKTHF